MNTLENIVYTVTDLDAAKAIHMALLGVQPHTDQPYYVGFNVADIEIGLTPAQAEGCTSTVAHIRVPDLATALGEVQKAGATLVSEPRHVGGGTRVAAVRDPAARPSASSSTARTPRDLDELHSPRHATPTRGYDHLSV